MLIAIVGAAGSGKSTALKFAAKSGYKTIDMDAYVHELYAFGQPGYRAIKEIFGDDFVNERGVDRKMLAKKVFEDPRSFELLKGSIYPLVEQKLLSLKGDWVVEMPAFTNDPSLWRPYFSAVVLIKADKDSRKARIVKKISRVENLSTSGVDNYVNLVNPHLRDADYTVDNEGSTAEFGQAVQTVLSRIFKG